MEKTEVTHPWILGAAIVIGALLPASAAGQESPSRLKDIGYAVSDTASTMTFTMQGQGAYSATQDGNSLVITFPATTAHKQLRGLRRLAQGGMIRSVNVAPKSDADLSVVVVIQDSAQYRFVHGESPDTFSLEVLGHGATLPHKKQIPVKTAALPQRRSSGTKAVVVDIPGIAAKQMEEMRQGGAGASPAMNVGRRPVTASLILVAMIGFPFVTGVAVLLLMYYRKRARRLAPALVGTSEATEAVTLESAPVPEMTPVSARPTSVEEAFSVLEAVRGVEDPSSVLVAERVEAAPIPVHAVETVFHDSLPTAPSFQIASALLPGSEQFELARRFAGETSDVTRKRIRKACATKTARTHRVRVAKRLGVGKGEVELALKLHDMAGRRARKEKKR
jgi:hypothetical protein